MKNKLLFYFVLILLNSCSFGQEKEKQKDAHGVKYAKGFTLEKTKHYQKLSILNPWDNYSVYANYYAMNDSSETPKDEQNLSFYFFHSPLTVALHTAPQAAWLKALKADQYIKGIGDPRFFYERKFSELIDSGRLIQSANKIGLNKERILLLQPDLIITSGWNTINADYKMMVKMGIPVLFMMEWMENNPLGRAEWIKALGVIFDKEKEADSIFNRVEHNYLKLKQQESNWKIRPKILHGEEYNGAWYVAGGKSYIAQIYSDAGADYLWKENQKSGSLVVDREVVLNKGAQADYWFTTFGQNKHDIEQIKESKYNLLKAVIKDQVYSNTKRKNQVGGNDFWESGSLRPDLILEDIIKIIHPESSSSDSLIYYKKLDIK
jgi:iron complex transport system substrate-binding protein